MIESVVVNFVNGENHVITFAPERGRWETEDTQLFDQLDQAIMHTFERQMEGIKEQKRSISGLTR
jgi:hypothetical protein